MKFKRRKFDPSIMHKKTYPFFERIFYRPIAGILTPPIAKMGFSPTMINFVGFFIGLGGIILIGLGSYSQRVIGAGILIISYIFDCVDGQLARGFKSTNGFGALLDTTLDSIKESLIFFALAWNYYYLQNHNKYIFLYLAGVLFLQRMFGRTLPWFRHLFRQEVNEIKTDTIAHSPKMLQFIAVFFSEAYRSGTIWIVIFLGVITNQVIITFLYFMTVLFILFIFLLFNAYRLQGKHG